MTQNVWMFCIIPWISHPVLTVMSQKPLHDRNMFLDIFKSERIQISLFELKQAHKRVSIKKNPVVKSSFL